MFFFYSFIGINLIAIVKTTTVWRDKANFVMSFLKIGKNVLLWGNVFSKTGYAAKNDNLRYNDNKYLNKFHIIKVSDVASEFCELFQVVIDVYIPS